MTTTMTTTIAAITTPGTHRPHGAGPAVPSADGSSSDALGAELRADTPAGAAMVATAERLAAEFADAALAHDRDATFATEHLDRLRQEGFLFAPVPEELGGGGVASVHDVLVAMSRLARGDASTSIGVNMHFVVLLNVLRGQRIAAARGDDEQAAALAGRLQLVTAAGVVFATAVSEPGPQDLLRPATRAERVEGGWRIDGRKAFATMASEATLVNIAVTYVADDGSERYGFALVPPTAPGVEFARDWDALGMRASESGSVTLRDVRVPPEGLRDGFATGAYSAAMLDRYLISGAFHAAASLGIAESAQQRIVASLRGKADATLQDAHAVMRLAENVVDLATMRAVLDRAGRLIDEHHADHPTGAATMAAAQAVYGEVQAAKTHINEAGSRVVDRALALSGGAGFMAAHPLAKAWRDARAGAFMHPLGANRAYDYLARTALGIEPR